MKQYGLIGKNIEYSFSPKIHKILGNPSYNLFSMDENELEYFLKNIHLDGFNVTVPYKETVLKACDFLSEDAKKIGAVNTVKYEDGQIKGYNTDIDGFLFLLKYSEISLEGKSVAILGTGGTSKMVQVVCEKEKAKKVYVVSRSGEINYGNLEKIHHCEIIINTTPIGMKGSTPESLINLDDFKKCQGVIDVNYNPLKSKLLLDAEKLNIKFCNGLPMLVCQAKEASDIFYKCSTKDKKIYKIISCIEKNARNIVFIGMPGSGKTTFGKIIADKLGRKFIDTDKVIEEKEGMKIPEIFEKFGEEYFRNLEKETIKQLKWENKCVIATGGGSVQFPENVENLRYNGYFVFLNPDISLLEVKGRPLSNGLEQLEKLAEKRMDTYKQLADVTVENIDSIVKAIKYLEERLLWKF